MKRKIGGIYIGELIFGTLFICGFVAVLMWGMNMAVPAWQ